MMFSSVSCLSVPQCCARDRASWCSTRVDQQLPGVLLLMSESLEIYQRTEKHGYVGKNVKSPNLSSLA